MKLSLGAVARGNGVFKFSGAVGYKDWRDLLQFLNECFLEYSIIFDATPAFAEFFAILFCVIHRTTWELKHVLVRCYALEGSVSGEATAELITDAMGGMPMKVKNCRAAHCDRAGANYKGIRDLQ